jgi:hypothetical protein
MLRTALGLVVLLALQTRPLPPTLPGSSVIARPGNTPLTGGAEIRGRILDARTSQPVAGARITAVTIGPGAQAVAVSDATGQYRLMGLPAGRYSVSAAAEGFLTTLHGQSEPIDSYTLVSLRSDDHIGNIDVHLRRGGDIVGTVIDPDGGPASGAYVMILRRVFRRGTSRIVQAARPITADRSGVFRFSQVASGEYYVSASKPWQIGGPAFGATYYTGATTPLKATPISVAEGKAFTLTFKLVSARLSDVAITIPGPDKRPLANSRLMIGPAEWTQGWVVPVPSTERMGMRLPPGTYFLHTLGNDPRAVTASSVGTLVIEEGSTTASTVLQPQTRSLVSGRIIVDAASRRSLQPAKIRVGVAVVNAGPNPGPQGVPGTVKPDLTFATESWPGSGVIALDSSEPGWSIKSVKLGGVDMTDTGVTIPNGRGVSGLEVELTNHPPEVAGMVTDAKGNVSQYVALVFAQDPKLQQTLSGRRVVLARPDQHGRFVTDSLLPGQYYAVALPRVSPDTWTDPLFLEKLRPLATSFSLADGEAKTLTLGLKSTVR